MIKWIKGLYAKFDELIENNRFYRWFIIISRLISLIVAVDIFITCTRELIDLLPAIQQKIKGTTLEFLIQKLITYWKTSVGLSYYVGRYCFALFLLMCAFSNFFKSNLYWKAYLFSMFGIPVICFFFFMILLSTKPSNITVLVSSLSFLGSIIAFLYTVFSSDTKK